MIPYISFELVRALFGDCNGPQDGEPQNHTGRREDEESRLAHNSGTAFVGPGERSVCAITSSSSKTGNKDSMTLQTGDIPPGSEAETT
jgi:hypothetical protein